MKDRNLLCEYYICAGQCKKGKVCYAQKEMQHCSLYIPNKQSQPLRTDKRKQKKEKILKKELNRERW